MIKHIVTWKLKEEYKGDAKELKVKEIKVALEGLVGKVNELKSLKVFFNSTDAPHDNYDIILDCEFETMADLEAYQVHPDHKACGEVIKPAVVSRAAIDYEF